MNGIDVKRRGVAAKKWNRAIRKMFLVFVPHVCQAQHEHDYLED